MRKKIGKNEKIKISQIVMLQTKHQENKSNLLISNVFESLNVKIAAWHVNGPFHELYIHYFLNGT